MANQISVDIIETDKNGEYRYQVGLRGAHVEDPHEQDRIRVVYAAKSRSEAADFVMGAMNVLDALVSLGVLTVEQR